MTPVISSRNVHRTIVVFLCALIQPIPAVQEWVWQRYNEDGTARHSIFVLWTMMDDTYADIVQTELEYNYIRFLYEQTPHYESGYVFGEIMERYRKIVEQFKRGTSFKNRHMYDYMDTIESMQKLFFEMYHLVCMMHEIPQKYKHEGIYRELLMTDEEREQIELAEKAFFESAEKQKKESKKRLKAELLKQELIAAGLATLAPEKKVGGSGGIKNALNFTQKDAKTVGQGLGPWGHSLAFPRKGWPFPLEYGWDIDNWD